MTYENPWIHNYSEVIDEPGEYVGFVYQITNLSNGRKYIGKKNFFFMKTKTVKKKKKRYKAESDWKEYYGSNAELQADVQELGPNQFKREILRLCKSKGDFNYYEAKYQFDLGVLESDLYYNSWIQVKVHKKHLTSNK